MDINVKETNIATEKKVVGTQLSKNTYEMLKEESERDFMSISDLLRKIIYLYFKNKNQ